MSQDHNSQEREPTFKKVVARLHRNLDAYVPKSSCTKTDELGKLEGLTGRAREFLSSDKPTEAHNNPCGEEEILKDLKTCPACGVRITADDKVLFSCGEPGTRARLYARVCRFAKKPGCINRDEEAIGELTDRDYYGGL